MPIPTAKLSQKRAKLRAKLDGTSVVLKWTEQADTPPAVDPVTGAYLVQEGDTNYGTLKTATVRAFIHFIAPVTSGIRIHAEVEEGDAIVDFPLDLVRVTDAGDTNLTAGDVVDEITFSAANRAAGVNDSAVGADVEPSELANLYMEFGGHKWVQKKIGENLAKSWDTLYSGLNINRAMLMTKA